MELYVTSASLVGTVLHAKVSALVGPAMRASGTVSATTAYMAVVCVHAWLHGPLFQTALRALAAMDRSASHHAQSTRTALYVVLLGSATTDLLETALAPAHSLGIAWTGHYVVSVLLVATAVIVYCAPQ